jgi:hypothetical protein
MSLYLKRAINKKIYINFKPPNLEATCDSPSSAKNTPAQVQVQVEPKVESPEIVVMEGHDGI